ncbi:MAG: TetR/AcrR family transcriptional regulator [Desulfobacterales bacterium]|nr:TetR/AcrR family transcriptional regulator [Desulfobacteraceae bacterium]MBT4364453.1 TetR/AcrR family transcriptional regulator [Desulfobacteraceae bacterium]MBT7086823.1 TetR/AcrR family transcriptional regulator [Desulfobacterales bacterium]
MEQKNKNNKYNLILEAAVKVFAANGFYNSTISQIAKEAGVADGTIYLYFKSKDDIMANFFSYKTKQVFDRFREVVELADDAVEKLRNLVRRHLEEFQADRNMAVVFHNEARQFHQGDVQISDITQMYLDILGEIIEKGQEEGQMRRDLYISLVKRYIIGAIDEVINTWVHAGGKYDLVTFTDPLVDLFINGIGSNINQNNNVR